MLTTLFAILHGALDALPRPEFHVEKVGGTAHYPPAPRGDEVARFGRRVVRRQSVLE